VVRNLRALLPTVALTLAVSTLYAQYDNGSLIGTIHDASGAVVPGATITATNTATGIAETQTSSPSGDYLFPSLHVGTYSITVVMSGFNKAVASNITVNVGTRGRVDLALQVGGSSENVEVSNVALALETDSSQRGQVITNQQTEGLPLATQDVAQLVALTTGVRTSSIGLQTQGTGLTREAAFNVEGQRSMFNNFLLDGIDNNAYGESNQGFSNQVIQPPPDSVAQFQVVTNNESAEFGRASGATINAAYASGTNAFHFNLYEFLRNTDLNAAGYFLAPGNKKLQFNRNQFGGNLSGPILRDKAFFFLDYEGFRQVRKLPAFSTLPLMGLRAGIVPAGETITDPKNGVKYAAGAQLPTGDFSPLAVQITNLLPAVNPTLTTAGNDYVQTQRFTDNSDKYDLRLDWQLNPSTSSFARISQRKETAVDFTPLPLPIDGGSNGNQRILDQQLALGITHAFGPTKLLDARLGVDYTKGGKFSLSLGQPGITVPGLPTDPTLVGGIPSITITGYAALGRQSTNPQWQYPFVWDPKVNYTWVLPKHTLKFGYEYMHTAMAVNDVNPLYGLFYFQGKYSGDNYADFLFGSESRYALSTFFIAQLRQQMHFAYVQDDWKPIEKLTINMGLRWEFGTPYYEKHNNLSNFDPSTSPQTGQLLQAKNGSIYDRSLVDPDYKDFAPRFGFAYAADSKTAIRGGFGMSYIHYNRAGSGNVLAINPPQVIFGVVSQSGPGSANYRTFDQGVPQNFTQAGNFNPLTANIAYVARNYKDSYVESYFLSVQRQLAKNSILDIAYVGNHGVKLLEFANYNQGNPALGVNPATKTFARPIATFGDITYAFNGAYSNYNGLQVRYEQREVHNLTLLNSFTWSRTLDNAASSLEDPNGNYSSAGNFYNLKADYGESAYDEPFNNTTSIIYDLPFGHGQRFLSHGRLGDTLVGGWQLSTINTMQSGQPLTIQYTPPAANQVSGIAADYRGANEYRPNRVASASILSHAKGQPTNFLNINAFAAPAATVRGVLQSPFGDLGRNPVRSDPFYQTDFAAMKDFPVLQQARLQFRAELFNVLNKTNFQPPNISLSSGAGSFGKITSTFDPRIIQCGLKLTY
jgi:hypothetical protein